jgi:hypothetical protein
MLYGMSLGATSANDADDDGDNEGVGGVGTRLVPVGKRVSFSFFVWDSFNWLLICV